MKRAIAAVVFALAPSISLAQQFDDWNVSPFEGGASAITKNDSGDEFGYVCLEQSNTCVWVLGLTDIECEPEADYPVLVNANTGASSMELRCFIFDGSHFMVFKDYDAI